MATSYDAAIKLSLVSNVSEGLAVIIARLAGAQAEVKKLEASIAGLKPAVLGAVAAFAGFETLKFVSHIEKAGEELVHIKTMMEAALPAQTRMADMAQVWAAATKEAGTNLRSTFAGNVNAIHDLYNITQSVGESGKLLAPFNILKNIMDSAKEKGFSGGVSDASIAAAVQALDLAGRTTEEALKPAAAALANTLIALGRRFDPEKFRTGVGSSGDARFGWSDEFLTKGFPALQALGLGSRAGSAMYQLHSNLFGGAGGALGSKIQADAQVKWGLHQLSDELFEGRRFKGFKVGSVFESDKLQKNPIEWANDYIAKLKAAGVDVADKKTMMLIAGEIGRGNKLLKSALDELLLPSTNRQLNREMANINKIGGDAISLISENDPKAWRDKLSKQWKNLEDIVGETLVDPFINNVLKPLTEMFKTMSQLGAADTGNLKLIAEGMVLLGGALMGGGVVAILAALGPAGWIAASIIAIGGAAILYKDKIKEFGEYVWKGLEKVTSALMKFVDYLNEIPGKIWGFITTLGGLFGKTSFPGSGFGGGASVHKAAWLSGGGVGALAAGGRGQYAGMIRSLGGAYASDLLKIYGTEGASGYVGDHGTSFGPFQFHYGGGIGDIFTRETGLDARNPATVGAQIEFMKRWGAKHGGYSSDIWHGLRGHGGSLASPHAVPHVAPYRKSSSPTIIENTMYLDGNVVHRSVVRRIVERATHPTSAPMHDGARHWTPPDSGLVAV